MNDNLPNKYIAVRCQVVLVKRHWLLGLRDKTIRYDVCIPDTIEQSYHIGDKIRELFKQYARAV